MISYDNMCTTGLITYVSWWRAGWFSAIFNKLQRHADWPSKPRLRLRDVAKRDVTHLFEDVAHGRVIGGVEAELERLQGPRELQGQTQQPASSGAGMGNGDRIDIVDDDDTQADNDDDEERRHIGSSNTDACRICQLM